MEKIGIFGSAFDPPTRGHDNVLSQAIQYFDQIILVPCFAHPFQKKMLDFEVRMQMLTMFQQKYKSLSTNIKISVIEKELYQKNQKYPIYTYHVLEALEQHYQDANKKVDLWFILGPDNIKHWKQFYRYHTIQKRWNLFPVHEMIPIRSTLVRNTIQKNKKNPQQLFQTLLEYIEPEIAKFIIHHQLYL